MRRSLSLQTFLAFITAALWLGGCNSIPSNLRPGDPLTIGDGEAVVLATVTMSHSSRFFERAGFYFKQVEGGGRYFHLDSAVPWTINPMLEDRPDPSLPAELNGRLYAFRIPAGTYALQMIKLHDAYHWAQPRDPITFELRGGTVTYIGNLHARLCHRVLVEDLGPDYVIGAHPSVTDLSDRDLPLLRSRFPQLAELNIEKVILDDAQVNETYAALYRKCTEHGAE